MGGRGRNVCESDLETFLETQSRDPVLIPQLGPLIMLTERTLSIFFLVIYEE